MATVIVIRNVDSGDKVCGCEVDVCVSGISRNSNVI